jgi:hypothetical protein
MPEGSWAGGFRPLLANRYPQAIITETALATTDATSGCTDAHAITWKILNVSVVWPGRAGPLWTRRAPAHDLRHCKAGR